MRVFCLSIFLCLPLIACGCTSKGDSQNDQINAWLTTGQENTLPAVYHVEAPDVLIVSAPRIKELDPTPRTIGLDGKITFNIIGSVYVAGKTTVQIEEELIQRLSRYYTRDALDVSVRVAEYRSKAIYVFGQVNSPGAKPYTGSDTLLKVLADAGLNDSSWSSRIAVARPNEDPNVHQKITVDVTHMFVTGDTSQNVPLEEGDLIYVPPTPSAYLSQTFTQILAPIRPMVTIFTFATGGI